MNEVHCCFSIIGKLSKQGFLIVNRVAFRDVLTAKPHLHNITAYNKDERGENKADKAKMINYEVIAATHFDFLSCAFSGLQHWIKTTYQSSVDL